MLALFASLASEQPGLVVPDLMSITVEAAGALSARHCCKCMLVSPTCMVPSWHMNLLHGKYQGATHIFSLHEHCRLCQQRCTCPQADLAGCGCWGYQHPLRPGCFWCNNLTSCRLSWRFCSRSEGAHADRGREWAEAFAGHLTAPPTAGV